MIQVQLSVEQRDDVQIVRVEEAKLTYPVLSAFFAEVRQLVESGARRLVIDLKNVSYIDSASIGCLIDIHHLLEERGGSVKLSGPKPRVQTMLSMVLVDKILDVYKDEAAALAAFGASGRRIVDLAPEGALGRARGRTRGEGA